MILKTLCKLHGIELHPKFEHFDRLVTLLVFVEMFDRIPRIIREAHPLTLITTFVGTIALWRRGD